MRYGVILKDDTQLLAWFTKVVEGIDDQVMNNYFGGEIWKNTSNFETRRTGRALVDQLHSLVNPSIIDIGCGDNELKQHFPDGNLIGIFKSFLTTITCFGNS